MISICVQMNAQATCRLNTPQAWDVFIQQFANSFPSPGRQRYAALNQHIQQCASMIRAQGLDRCLGRIGEVGFEFQHSPYAQNGDYQYTPMMTNAQYLAAQPQARMQPPPELANGLPANWQDIARQRGWEWTWGPSKAQQPGQRGMLNRRLIIRVRNQGYDQLLLFVSATNDPTQHERVQMQVIETDQPPAGSAPRIHFRELAASTNRGPLQGSHGHGGRCVYCHVRGPLATRDPPNSVWPNGRAPMATTESSPGVRARFARQFSGMRPPPDMTPYTGARRIPFQGLEVGGDNPNCGESGHAQCGGCMGCHGDSGRSRFQPLFNADGSIRLPYAVRFHLSTQQTMPPGSSMTQAQRDATYAEMDAQLSVNMRDWLLAGQRCASLNTGGCAANSPPVNTALVSSDPTRWLLNYRSTCGTGPAANHDFARPQGAPEPVLRLPPNPYINRNQ